MPTTMKDSLNDLFRQRFQGHEAPVDAGTWAVIEAKIITAPPPADPVSDLFRERFQGHEVPVDAAVWEGIRSQLGQGATVGSGLFGGYGWLIAAGAAALIAGALMLKRSGPSAPQAAAPHPVPQAAVAAPAAMAETPVAQAEPAAVSESLAAVHPGSKAKAVQSAPRGSEQATEAEPAPGGPAMAEAESPAVVEHIIQAMTERARNEAAAPAAPVEQAKAAQGHHGISEAEAAAPEPPPATVHKPFMPNTFTPNNDGINDTYVVPMEGFTSMMIRVYSIKTNQLVFSTNTGEPWTGANCEEGMYLVAVEAITAEGQVVAEGKVVYLNRTGTN